MNAWANRLQRCQTPAWFRARHNRNLAEGGKLLDKVEAGQVRGEIAFFLPGRAGQKAREVRQP